MISSGTLASTLRDRIDAENAEKLARIALATPEGGEWPRTKTP